MDVKQLIEDYGYEDVIIFDNPDYDYAFIGVTIDNRAVYDFDLMVKWLMEHEMSEEEAVEFIYYNSSFSMEGYPLIVNILNGGDI